VPDRGDVPTDTDVGLRLGLMAGLAVDWFGVEAYDQVGSYDLGAQAVFHDILEHR